ncbi:MAG TPA: hypothetical protein VGC86_10855 [Afipia sp.]
MSSVDQAGHIEQHKGELKRPPLRFVECIWIAGRAGDPASGRHGDGEIHEVERLTRLAVGREEGDSVRDAGLCRLHVGDEALTCFAAPGW